MESETHPLQQYASAEVVKTAQIKVDVQIDVVQHDLRQTYGGELVGMDEYPRAEDHWCGGVHGIKCVKDLVELACCCVHVDLQLDSRTFRPALDLGDAIFA